MDGSKRAPLLAIRGVWKTFRAGIPGCSASVRALRGASLSVSSGEVVALTGGAGAGKTTLLLCAAAMLRPDRGSVWWRGRPACPFDKSHIGLVPSSPVFRASLTVGDVVALHEPPAPFTTGPSFAVRLLRRLELWGRREELVGQLGTSLLRRLALACVLAAEPAVLLVDLGEAEDAAGEALLLSTAAAHSRRGTAVVVAGREKSGVTAFATRHELLEHGVLVCSSGREGADRLEHSTNVRVVARRAGVHVRVAEPGVW